MECKLGELNKEKENNLSSHSFFLDYQILELPEWVWVLRPSFSKLLWPPPPTINTSSEAMRRGMTFWSIYFSMWPEAGNCLERKKLKLKLMLKYTSNWGSNFTNLNLDISFNKNQNIVVCGNFSNLNRWFFVYFSNNLGDICFSSLLCFFFYNLVGQYLVSNDWRLSNSI